MNRRFPEYGEVKFGDNSLRKFALRSLHGKRGFSGWYEITDKDGNVHFCDISIPAVYCEKLLGIHVVGLAVLYQDCMWENPIYIGSTYDSGYTMVDLESLYVNA